MPDGESLARRLWRASGVRVLPGAYLGRETDPRLGSGNPGDGYIRVALVAPRDVVARGLEAIRDALTLNET